MGTVETIARKRRRLGTIQHAVLGTIAVAGILLVAAAAPNALQLLGGFSRKRYQFNYQVKSALTRLARCGYIRFGENGGKKYAELTEAGRKALLLETYRNGEKLRGRKRWDKRWRMIAFDIPERLKNARNQLRMTMREVGFFRLQDSMWVFPYDCEDFVQLLKTDLHVGKYVLYAVVESIENDAVIRTRFGLPS